MSYTLLLRRTNSEEDTEEDTARKASEVTREVNLSADSAKVKREKQKRRSDLLFCLQFIRRDRKLETINPTGGYTR